MDKQWTDEELREFEDLVNAGDSRDQLERIRSRTTMPGFIQKHGREKCDAMFKFICERDGY